MFRKRPARKQPLKAEHLCNFLAQVVDMTTV